MHTTTRREFVKQGVVAGAVAAGTAWAAPLILSQEARGANDRIGVGFIGTGGRCGAHLAIVNQFKEQGIAEPVAVCDVYRPRLEAASQATGGASMYMEHEALLGRPECGCGLHCQSRSIARSADHGRAEGGQGRLL